MAKDKTNPRNINRLRGFLFFMPAGESQKEDTKRQGLVSKSYPLFIFSKRGTNCPKLAVPSRDLSCMYQSHFQLVMLVL